MAVDKNKKKALDAEITDALLDDFDKFEHFATNYWKQIGIVAVIIVIGVAVWVMVADARQAADRKANNALANAKTEAEILTVVKEYSSYPAANYARMRLARIYLGEKKYDKAYEQFKLLHASDIPREMAWRISLDEAYALELQGKKAEAAAKFAEIGANPSLPEGFRCEANYGAGRLYSDSGQKDLAVKYLTKTANTPQDQTTFFWVSQANYLLVRLPKSSVSATAPDISAELKKFQK